MNLVLAATDGAPLADVASATAGTPVAFAWLLPVLPAVSAALLLMFGKRLGTASAFVAIGVSAATAALSIAIFTFLQGQPEAARSFTHEVATWLDIGDFTVSWSLLVDPLSAVMLLLVTCVGTLIHIYSVGYMHGDEKYPRFFAYLNLFLASMLILVLGDNFLTLFVGWELVGLCSYLLIGFWFANRDYASAAKKAFVVNRIGDVGFMIAMFVIFSAFGSLAFADVLPAASEVLAGDSTTAMWIAVLLFIAATGKSAQLPLFVWLPDAMAGPTPVSALIHAATMVTAGVYLIARTSPIFTLVPNVGLVIAWIGVATALVGALSALAQTDLKKILAYSTVSQLGYMFVGVGLGNHVAGIFHLLTHGFFKALLFLAAGSVMHAVNDETDVRKMGGLLKKMPFTAGTSLVAVAAIAGVPFLSGFYSKEEILASAVYADNAAPIWFIGLAVAGLTAVYMARWFVLIFLGKPRWDKGVEPHESPATMTVPLVLLAVASLFGGFINIDPEAGFLYGWLGGTVTGFELSGGFIGSAVYIGAAVVAALGGLMVGYLAYRDPDYRKIGTGTGLVAFARNTFFIDELYDTTIARPGLQLSHWFAWFDRTVIDGLANGSAWVTTNTARIVRRTQNGHVRSYSLAVLAGAAVVVLVMFGGLYVGGF